MENILVKIKNAGLVGRGGASYPTWQKWLAVKEAAGIEKYVICNCSEGEPGVSKDGYLIEKYPEKVIEGMKIAIDFLSTNDAKGETIVKGYFFINHQYAKKYSKKLKIAIGDLPIEIFIKPIEGGYIGGEESSLINAIEGRRIEPRLRPPFPTTNGLWGKPTLVNNVETFYNVSLVDSGLYKNTRFYTLGGDCLNNGIYELSEKMTIREILIKTENLPKFSFFVQIGGDGSGEVLNSEQLDQPADGAGSIRIYSLERYDPKRLIQSWLEFFTNESCGQCTSCREGTYRLLEMIKNPKINWELFAQLLNNLRDTAFCGLGGAAPMAITSFMKNVLFDYPDKKIANLKASKQELISIFK